MWLMDPSRYATCVIPIGAFFASSLWFGNTAYLHISMAFIQMLKALSIFAEALRLVFNSSPPAKEEAFWEKLKSAATKKVACIFALLSYCYLIGCFKIQCIVATTSTNTL